MKGDQASREQIARHIKELRRLHQFPGEELEHTLNIPEDPTRYLSVAREEELASTLAFIANTSLEDHEVMAVCVEEELVERGLIIRLAENNGNFGTLATDFKDLSLILMETAERSSTFHPEIR